MFRSLDKYERSIRSTQRAVVTRLGESEEATNDSLIIGFI